MKNFKSMRHAEHDRIKDYETGNLTSLSEKVQGRAAQLVE